MSEFDLDKFVRAYSLTAIDSLVDMLNIINREELEIPSLLETVKAVSKEKHLVRARNADKTTGRSPSMGGMPDSSYKEDKRRVAKLEVVIGVCPKCGGWIRGEPVGGCGGKKNGRHFYRECESCNYYAEIFKVRNKFKEVEGG